MISLDSRTVIDATIDASLKRLADRAGSLGPGFEALAQSIQRSATGGKRFRPALVAASFAAFDGRPEQTPALYSVSAAFELLHTAFVIHDDVIDNDTMRRGVPNVVGEFQLRAHEKGADAAGAALLGDAAGILAGDLLLHESARLVALADVSPPVRESLFDLLDEAIYVSAAGELADVENSVTPDHAATDVILSATFNKTAVYSFSAPLRAGALLAGAGPAALDALDRAGGRLGLAFQLVDDLIGAFGSAEQAGRDEGVDLRESKKTPLIALARDTPIWPRVNDALLLAHTGPIAIRDAQLALEESGARGLLRQMIEDTLDDVHTAALDPALPDAANLLVCELADSVAERVP